MGLPIKRETTVSEPKHTFMGLDPLCPTARVGRLARKIGCYFLAPRMCVLTALALLPSLARAQPAPTIEAISKAWHNREDRSQTVRAAWTESVTLPKGSVSDMYATLGRMAIPRLKEMGIGPGDIIPPTDTTFDIAASLILDGNKVRLTREDRHWSPKSRSFVTEPETLVFDGKVGTAFSPTGVSYAPYPQATIQKRHPVGNSVNLISLVMTFRPFSSQMRQFDIDSFVVSGSRRITGRQYVELQRRVGAREETLWLDPAQGFSVRRYLDLQNGFVRTKVEVSYRADTICDWIPEAWSIISQDAKGKLQRSTQAKLQSCELGMPVGSDAFEIELPVGTSVLDRTSSHHEDYIQLDAGRKRPILPEDRGATYDQIVTSNAGEAFGKPAWRIRKTVLIAALAAAAAIAWFVRRRIAMRRRRAQTSA